MVFNNNGTVSTVPKHPLVWDEELSMGRREDDVLMLPNIALLVRYFFLSRLFCTPDFRMTYWLLIQHFYNDYDYLPSESILFDPQEKI